MMNRQDITIFIPTHNRHQYLQRIIDYYSFYKIEWPIIICDSTCHKFNGELRQKNIKYLHYPMAKYVTKISEGMGSVQTKYCVMCADDDFIVPQTIKSCVSFLKKNKDYSSVQGKYISFIYSGGNNFKLTPSYIPNYKVDISSDNACERLLQQFNPYMHQFYSVHHIQTLRDCFNIALGSFKNGCLIEIAVAMMASINGKHKILQNFYCAREIITLSAGSTYDKMDIVAAGKEYKTEYNNFLERITQYLVSKTDLDYDSARTCILSAIDVYLYKFMTGRQKQGPTTKLKTKIKKVLPENMYNHLKKAYKQMQAMVCNDTSITFNQYFDQFDSQSKEELQIIQSFIQKHDITHQT